MKKLHLYYIITLLAGLSVCSCNDEWEDELFEKAVSFGRTGLVDIHVRYQESGSVDFEIPLVVSGSTENGENVEVTLEIDKDTLEELNFARFRKREDLYYLELDPKYYEFESMTTTIPAGHNTGTLTVNFKLGDLDLVDKYILPLKVASTSVYKPSDRKYFNKTLMNVIPFNDYSGVYSATNGFIYDEDDPSQPAMNAGSRDARVVNHNTVFFYAGITDEEAQDRAKYKIMAQFNPDSTLTLTAPDPAIQFQQLEGSYTIETKMDEGQPYLERKYITMRMKYKYNDITNPESPFHYRFEGTLTLERKRNTQIPDEDQQYIF